jgi:ABC-type multidrug transport system ATPase subunit
MSVPPAIRLQGLKKNFGASEIIRGVDLDIHRGERHAIIGPNGAGKSTLFHLISARLPITSGTHRTQGRGRGRAEALRDQPQGAFAQLPDHQHLPQPLGVREPALRRALVAGLPLLLLAAPVAGLKDARHRAER